MNISNETGSFSSNAAITMTGNGNGNLTVGVQASNFPNGSTGYSMQGSGNIVNFLRNDGITLGPSSTEGGTGDAKGRFVGNAAQGVIMVITGQKNTPNNRISGTAVGFRN